MKSRILSVLTDPLRVRMMDHRSTMDPNHPRDLLDVLLARVDGETDPESPFYNGDNNNNDKSNDVKGASIVTDDNNNKLAGKAIAGSVSDFGYGDLTVLNVLVDLFMAGMETTASSLAWTFLYLLHHPEVQRRVHEEMDLALGRPGHSRRPPSLSDRRRLPFACAVIHESLRMTGFVYLGFPRFVTDPEGVRVGRYVVPPGATVLPNLFHVMNDPDYWHEPRWTFTYCFYFNQLEYGK